MSEHRLPAGPGLAAMRALVIGLFATALLVGPATADAKCVDVETASAKQLQALKGVGPKVARAIVAHRKRMRTAATKAKAKRVKWKFNNWKTLMTVKGVGPDICRHNLATLCFSGRVQKVCPKPAKKVAKKAARKAKKRR